MENHIHYKTTGGDLGYRDLIKKDEPVCTNSMGNKLGRLSQGWKNIHETTQWSSFYNKTIQSTEGEPM